MAVIHVLDQHTAELIAAGEVVERPASVAKELLENAVDASATQITLSITRGGVGELQIADNGSGIEAEYISKAFIRHATSKIQTERDLDNIHTLGFRGEALASIASVARVEVLTQTEVDEFACLYRIEGGKELGIEAAARPQGTTITVRELFYNTPARMKFLKKDASEGTFVAEVVQHTALSHPEISFRFIREGKQQFVTPGDGDLRAAAYAVLGREFSRDLLPVDAMTGQYKLTGLITPPRACRASRGAQYFFINGRYVKNRTMMAALENAYKGTLMQGKFPGAVLMLTMPAPLVDVNVHPAKTEVRFAREAEVFEAVYSAVKQALAAPGSSEQRFNLNKPGVGTAAPQPEKHFSTMDARQYRSLSTSAAPAAASAQTTVVPTRPAAPPAPGPVRAAITPVPAAQVPVQSFASPLSMHSTPAFLAEDESILNVMPDLPVKEADERTTHSQMAQTQAAPQKADETMPEPEAVNLMESMEAASVQTAKMPAPTMPETEQQSMLPATEPADEPLQYVGEVFKTYIITQRGKELCLIDKHAAHERILFEHLTEHYGDVPSQLLLMPVQVNLTAAEKQAVLDNLDMLEKAGVDAEDFGGSTILVRAVPADIPVDDVEDMLVELAAKLIDGSKDALTEKTEWVLHSIACRAAVKAGDRNDAKQLLALAQEILSGRVPPFCPHGRPCVLKLTQRELEKQFGRIV